MNGAALGLAPGPMRDSCPDCNAEADLAEVEPNVFVLVVRHDVTCPMLAQQVRARGNS